MNITIPDPPVFADIPLPVAPVINMPVLDVPEISEPVINDPSNSLLDFVYTRYARAINAIMEGKIEELLTWSGNPQYFKDTTEKATDLIMIKLVEAQNAILKEAASRGFKHLPGQAIDDANAIRLSANEDVIKAGLDTQQELSDNALKFINFATAAGIDHIKIALNENKTIVYANMAAVKTMTESIVATQRAYISMFEAQVKQYELLLKNLKMQLAPAEIALTEYDVDIQRARQEIAKQDIILDQRHAENLGVSILNANTLLQASECLQKAELEKQKVLQTHAILSGYLAQIKEAHVALVQNRSEVEIVLADLDYYKSQASLADQQAKGTLAKINGAKSELNQRFQLAMSEIKKAKSEIGAVEATGDSAKIEGQIQSERYSLQLKETLVGCENINLEGLSNQNVAISAWVAELEGTYTENVANMRTDHKGETISMEASDSVKRQRVKACADLADAEFQSRSDTILNLIQNIGS